VMIGCSATDRYACTILVNKLIVTSSMASSDIHWRQLILDIVSLRVDESFECFVTLHDDTSINQRNKTFLRIGILVWDWWNASLHSGPLAGATLTLNSANETRGDGYAIKCRHCAEHDDTRNYLGNPHSFAGGFAV